MEEQRKCGCMNFRKDLWTFDAEIIMFDFIYTFCV